MLLTPALMTSSIYPRKDVKTLVDVMIDFIVITIPRYRNVINLPQGAMHIKLINIE